MDLPPMTASHGSGTTWKVAGFDLDGTLIMGSTVLLHVGGHLGRRAEVESLVKGYESYKLSNYEVTVAAAEIFAGLERRSLLQFMDDVPRIGEIRHVVNALKSRGLRTLVATVSFDFAAEWFMLRYGFDSHCGISLEFDKDDRTTGRVLRHTSEDDKADFVAQECRRWGYSIAQAFYVGDSRSDLSVFRSVGFAIALNASPDARANAHVSVDTSSLWDVLPSVPGLL